MLPVEYFHVVFTVPEPIAQIAFYNKEVVYEILFRATAETLLTIARDPQRLGVTPGFFCVLHSWRQNLHFHPHLHCVVPAVCWLSKTASSPSPGRITARAARTK